MGKRFIENESQRKIPPAKITLLYDSDVPLFSRLVTAHEPTDEQNHDHVCNAEVQHVVQHETDAHLVVCRDASSIAPNEDVHTIYNCVGQPKEDKEADRDKRVAQKLFRFSFAGDCVHRHCEKDVGKNRDDEVPIQHQFVHDGVERERQTIDAVSGVEQSLYEGNVNRAHCDQDIADPEQDPAPCKHGEEPPDGLSHRLAALRKSWFLDVLEPVHHRVPPLLESCHWV